jgi:carboxymethylenebutenolidase
MAEADAAPRMKASDFHPYILEIFDGYVHGKLSKREFILEAGKFAAAGVTGLMILQQHLRPTMRWRSR